MTELNCAIATIAYNRIDSLQRLLNSLDCGYYDSQSIDLIISIDKSGSNEVESFAEQFQWNYGTKHIITHEVNLGLRKHILSIGEHLKKYDALIVLEDDITVSPNFVRYARQCVNFYHDDERIAGISLYNFPINYHNKLPFNPVKSEYDVFFMNCAQSWGQVWMRNQWQEFLRWYNLHDEEFRERKDLPYSICHWPKNSWLKYHTRYCIETNKYFVYPYYSLSTNNSDAGTHVGSSSTLFQANMQSLSQKDYKLVPLDKAVVKYDGYFEPKFLNQYLGVDENDICIDLLGLKNNYANKRYWLTREAEPYKIIEKYSMTYSPIELNVIMNSPGNAIFLYDTSIEDTPPERYSFLLLHKYFFKYSFSLLLENVNSSTVLIEILKSRYKYIRKKMLRRR